MDNVTHALLGIGLISLRRHPIEESRGIWTAVILGSEAPDFDILPGLVNSQAQVAWHRGASHGWVGLAIIVGLITLCLGLLDPRVPRKRVAAWTGLAVLIHVIFDALTSYGTRVLLPYMGQPVSLDILYIVDLPIVLMLAVGSGYFIFKKKPNIMRVALVLVLLYVGGRGVLHSQLVTQVGKTFGQERYSVVPLLNPWGNWLVLIDDGERYVRGEINPFSKSLVLQENYPKNLQNPLVKQIARNPVIDSFLEIARYPYAEIIPLEEGWRIKFADLRQWPYGGFTATVFLDKDLQLKNIKFSTGNQGDFFKFSHN